MPEALPAGYALHVDNLSYTDSVENCFAKESQYSRHSIGISSYQRRKASQVLSDRR